MTFEELLMQLEEAYKLIEIGKTANGHERLKQLLERLREEAKP